MTLTLIGIDCATDNRKIGLALGSLEGEQVTIRALKAGNRREPNAATVVEWIPDKGPTLLALDAPLGWPTQLGNALSNHSAGQHIDVSRNRLFRRATDRIVKQVVGQQPLDVGANLIAHTAHAALELLQELRERTNQPIPLAWDPQIESIAAIEVYPAGTLTAYGVRARGYKQKQQREARVEILEALRERVSTALLLSNADVLDAVVCMLAAADFLRGNVIQPEDRALAKKEGWIWVHSS